MNAAPQLEVKAETARLNAAFIELANATGRGFGSIVLQNSRLIAWNLAHNTIPYGMDLAAKKAMEASVMVDIGEIYKSASVIYGLLKQENEKLAKAWYKSVQSGNFSLASDLLKETSLRDRDAFIGPLDPDFHRKNRDGLGRVNRPRAAQIVPTARELKKYIKDSQQLVGFGKAGWITAGNQIGKVTRVPGWITRHVGKAPGAAIDNTKGIDPHVILSNDVRYISTICPPHQIVNALAYQREKMLSHIDHVLASEAQKAGFKYSGPTGTPLAAAA